MERKCDENDNCIEDPDCEISLDELSALSNKCSGRRSMKEDEGEMEIEICNRPSRDNASLPGNGEKLTTNVTTTYTHLKHVAEFETKHGGGNQRYDVSDSSEASTMEYGFAGAVICPVIKHEEGSYQYVILAYGPFPEHEPDKLTLIHKDVERLASQSGRVEPVNNLRNTSSTSLDSGPCLTSTPDRGRTVGEIVVLDDKTHQSKSVKIETESYEKLPIPEAVVSHYTKEEINVEDSFVVSEVPDAQQEDSNGKHAFEKEEGEKESHVIAKKVSKSIRRRRKGTTRWSKPKRSGRSYKYQKAEGSLSSFDAEVQSDHIAEKVKHSNASSKEVELPVKTSVKRKKLTINADVSENECRPGVFGLDKGTSSFVHTPPNKTAKGSCEEKNKATNNLVNHSISQTGKIESNSNNQAKNKAQSYIDKGAQTLAPRFGDGMSPGSHMFPTRRRQPNAQKRLAWCRTCLKTFSSVKEMKKHTKFYPNRLCAEIKTELKIQLKKCREVHSTKLVSSNIPSSEINLPAGNAVKKDAEKKEDSMMLCSVCNRSFCTAKGLSSHVRHIHPLEKTFQCKICSEKFFLKSSFDRHSKDHHQEGRPGSYKCHICFKLYVRKANLQRHFLSHPDLKPYVCQVCGADYRSKDNFNIHQLGMSHF